MDPFTAMMIAGLVSNAFGAYNQSKADKGAYKYQAAIARNNAQIAEWQARDAIARGQTAEQTQRLKTAQFKSSQRASMAARGVALDEGSPANILADTDYMGNLDALTIRDNAAREAWGHRVQGANYTSESSLLKNRASAEKPLMAAFSSLLGGSGAVSESWYRRSSSSGSSGGDYRSSLQTAASQFGWD